MRLAGFVALPLFAAPAVACDSPAVLDLFPDAGASANGGDGNRGDAGTTGGAPSADAAPGTGGTSGGASSTPLLHRYSFEGVGTTVTDSIGGADGEVMGGAALDGSGWLTLDGSNDFVDLPNGLISGLSSATVMAWIRWQGGPCWHRIFDFGNTDEGEGNIGNALTTLFLTPEPCPEAGPLVTFRIGDEGGGTAETGTLARPGEDQHYAVVIDGSQSTLALYVDGAQADVTPIDAELSQLVDENVWLGQSQWVQDLHFAGAYDEFRIYGTALSAPAITEAYELGPDVVE
jgi:hypothetical protein